MRKYIVLAIYIASSMVSSFAQVGNQQMLKCVFHEEAINRVDQPDKITQDEFALCISGNRSAFYSRNARLYSETKDSLERLGMAPMEILGALQSIPKGKSIEVYKNQPEVGKYICYDEVVQCFRFEDTLPCLSGRLKMSQRTYWDMPVKRLLANYITVNGRYGLLWIFLFRKDLGC